MTDDILKRLRDLADCMEVFFMECGISLVAYLAADRIEELERQIKELENELDNIEYEMCELEDRDD